ncbi:MAG TPA: NAD-binding protein [Gemmatimonadales bacterium]|nr:NAD-binding protein [Gemmatimonadales bacterium]
MRSFVIRNLPRSYRRLLILLLSLPVLLVVLGLVYQLGMLYLEGQPRTLLDSIEWAAESLTTTGYGRDMHWVHPAMVGYVVAVQFVGTMLVFLVFPVFLIPFFEERFEARLPRVLPPMAGRVLIYRYGPAVTSLLDLLEHEGVSAVVFEEDEATARRLRERGLEVVFGNLREEDPDLSNLVGARGLVLNGEDNYNAAMTLNARYYGYTGKIVAMVQDPNRRPPMVRAGATTAFTPTHVLAAALAARASMKISPRVAGVRHLGEHLEVAELRVHAASPFAGKTIGEARIREQTGATIIGLWVGGVLSAQPRLDSPLNVGTILVAIGSHTSIDRLGALATPVPREGAFLVVGDTEIGRKVTEFLRDAGETVRLLAPAAAPGVDVVGDHLDNKVLEQVGVGGLQGIILALDSDSGTLFATAVMRSLSPDAMIMAGVRQAENVARIHRAGADFALSMSQVAGQLLSYHLLGQSAVSLEGKIKIVATAAGNFVGRPLLKHWIRDRTGCSVVAVERGDKIIVDFDETFEVRDGDIVYLSGTNETIQTYFQMFPATREIRIPTLHTGLVDDSGAAAPRSIDLDLTG